jgi:retinol dehydrogenase-12
MAPPVADVTAQGYDLQFGTNTLGRSQRPYVIRVGVNGRFVGHFYFTKLLLPTLLATAKASPNGTARVINVSSAAHHWHNGSIDFNTLKDGPARKKKYSLMLYGQSKIVCPFTFFSLEAQC